MRKGAIKTLRHDTECIIDAFAKGSGFEIITPNDYFMAPNEFECIAVNGYLRGSGECVKDAITRGIDYYYIDHAYLKPHRDAKTINDDSWFRISKNGMQNPNFRERPSGRFEKYFSNLQVLPWKKPGKMVMIIGLSDHMKNFWGLSDWNKQIAKQIHKQIKNTDLIVRTREKPKRRIKGPAKDINYGSLYGLACYLNTAMSIEGLMNGVPVFTHGKNIAAQFSSGYDKILEPWRGDRMPLLYHASYSQFTVGEMKSGFAWEILTEE